MKNPAQTTLFKACRKYTTFLVALLISYNSAYAQLSGYSFKKKITIDNAKVSGTADLTDFPFLISLTDADLRTTGNAGDVTNANGYDIVFTASDGSTLLDHEIEKYVATTGAYEAWVRIPTLDYNDNTDIYLYYGNASVSTDPSTTNTWDANYKGVWHLNDDFLDGTANNNDGTNNGSSDIDGKMGDGQSFDGADDYIDAGSDASLDNIFAGGGTIEAWINPASFGESDFGRILVKSTNTSSSNGWSFIVNDVTVNGGMMFNHGFSGETGRWTTPDLSIVTSTWHHLVVTYDNGSVTNDPIIYINGTPVSLVEFATPTGTAVSDAAQDVLVGNILNQSRTFDGLIDEVRISNTIRSADWIATEFNNQDDPSAFYSVGVEEATAAPGNVYTNLTLWLKAGTGISGVPTVTAWADQSGSSNHTNISDPIGSPQLLSNAINYNPAIGFDGPKDYLETSKTSLIGSNNPYTKYVVVASDNLGKEMGLISSDVNGNFGMRQSNSGQCEATHNGIPLLEGANLVLNQPTIFGLRYGGGPLDNFVSVNGDIVVDNAVRAFSDDGTTQIGAWQGNYNFEGVIAEAIIYTTEVSDTDIKKVESYLAIKYGLSLSNAAGGIAGDYLASNGSLIWDASVNSSYHNDIAGIGRDDSTALNQQKSQSGNSDAMVIMDKGAAFGTDLDYIIWGNDNGSTMSTTTDKVPAYTSRLTRKWKVAISGTPGTVTVRMIYAANNGIAADYALHVDADGTFATGATSYVASSISGDTISFSGVSFANGDYFTLGNQSTLPEVAFNNTSSSGLESKSSEDLAVSISATSALDVFVDYMVTGTATGAGTDYTLASGTLKIKAGDSDNQEDITISLIVDDAIAEGNETVIVTLSNPVNATLGVNTVHTYTIIDNDSAPTVGFNSVSSSGLESVSSANLAVEISAVSGLDITVDYTITGTATGADYTLTNGTLTILAGDADNSENITIASIVDDLLDETNETVIVTLSNPTNATLGANIVHTYTILDNDATPTVAFFSTSSNGSESVSSVDLAVDMSAASSLDVSVDYTVTGTATGTGTDYILADGTLTISAVDEDIFIICHHPPGNPTNTQTMKVVASKLQAHLNHGDEIGACDGDTPIASANITIVSIVDDLLDETNETVIVTLSNPKNATLGANTVHTYTILDNDSAPTVGFNSASSSGLESVSSANLAIDISAVSGLDVTVDYTVTGTATGADYTLANGTLTISAGDADNSENITIASIVDDLLDENNETVVVTLSNPSNATMGANTVHTYTINDNDASPSIAFNSASSAGDESVALANLTVDLGAVSALDVTVDYSITGTATGGGTDYTLADGTLSILAGNNSGNITIASIVDDLLDENNETVIVTLSNPTNATLGANTVHTYTINDNDAAPLVAFTNSSSNGDESIATANLAVSLSAASSFNVDVDYAVTGTATGSGTDYTLADGTLTITAGSTSADITIASIVDDLMDEADETVIVVLSNPTNAALGAIAAHTYTINDNDATPTVAFNSASSSGDESVSTANLTVDINATSSFDVSVDYTVAGTATGEGTDYTLANGTLTIPAGAISGVIVIASIVDDILDEADETVIVTLSNANNAVLGANTVHTYTIIDNEAAPVAVDDLNNSTPEDTLLTIHTIGSNDTDVDGTVAAASIILIDPNNAGNTGHSSSPLVIAGIGTYTIDVAGTLVFTPEANFHGTADVQYTIEDNDGLVSNTATVAIEVLLQNDAPVADDDAAVVNEGASVTIDIVNGDNDADGKLDLSSIMISNLTNGSVVDNGDGTVDFIHDDSETTTGGFTYTIQDDEGSVSNVATVSITVNPVNDAPAAANDVATIDEGHVLNGPSLLANDTDVEGDPLTINITPVADVSNGTLTIQSDGTYAYTPDAGFFGTDSFTYEVCDSQGGCATAQVLITINSIDYDGDGILDVDEGTVDTDNDGIPDYQDIDSDNDNILDEEEGNIDTDGDGTANFRDLDSDDDGFSDLIETNADCDGDGTPNYLDLDLCGVTIPKGISPNGDGDNDEWVIQGIEQYPENNVKVFNRWGNQVYEGNGYDNLEVVWYGQSEGALTLIGDEVAEGSYFYVIELGEGSKPLSGYVIVKR